MEIMFNNWYYKTNMDNCTKSVSGSFLYKRFIKIIGLCAISYYFVIFLRNNGLKSMKVFLRSKITQFLIDIIEDDKIQDTVEDKMKKIMLNIFNDKEVKKSFEQNMIEITKNTFQNNDFIKMIRDNIKKLTEDEKINNSIGSFIMAIFFHDEMIKKINEYIQRNETKESLENILTYIMTNQNLKILFSKIVDETIIKLLENEQIKNSAADYLKVTVIDTLKSETVYNSAMESSCKLINDEEISETFKGTIYTILNDEDFKEIVSAQVLEAIVDKIKEKFPGSFGLFM